MAGRYQGPIRTIGLLGGLGFMLALSVLLGAFVGSYLDRRWGTEPWMTLIGTLLGAAAGFYEIFNTLKQFDEGNDHKSRN